MPKLEELESWCAEARRLLALGATSTVSQTRLAGATLQDAKELLKAATDPDARAKVKAQARAAVDAARLESDTLRATLKSEMGRLTAGEALDPGALAALKKLAEQELQRDAAMAKLQAGAMELELGLPPSPAKVAFSANTEAGASQWTEPVCKAAFKAYTWFDFKKLRKTGAPVAVAGLATQTTITDEVMWKLYQYRRHYVDTLIARLHRDYADAGLLFKSGGSEDIESDFDITVASPGNGQDVAAMLDFNDTVKAEFSRPPGRVFDTNLYARDYNAIKDNLTVGRDGAAPADDDIAEPAGPMKQMADIDQDVATLMKQRRFMDDESFTKMWKGLQASMKIPADQARIQQRFEEAEAVYLMTTVEKVDAILAKVGPVVARHDADDAKAGELTEAGVRRKEFRAQLALFQAAREDAMPFRIQRMMPKFLDFLEASFEDEVMDATDEIYAKRMAALREDQIAIARSDALLASHPAGADCERFHPGQTHEQFVAGIEGALAAPKARAKQAQFTNIVFANEAYVSQGAIKHIVAGKQADDPAVLEKIAPAELLQSTNEQLADFLKDMKHMAHAEHDAPTATAKRRASGEAFVHASKYLARMLEAMAMLEGKYKAEPAVLAQLTVPKIPLLATAGAGSAAELQRTIEEKLVRLRKSSTLPGDTKAELAVAEVMALFKTPDIAALRSEIQAFCVEFNLRVRQLDSFRAAQTVERETERQYFKG